MRGPMALDAVWEGRRHYAWSHGTGCSGRAGGSGVWSRGAVYQLPLAGETLEDDPVVIIKVPAVAPVRYTQATRP
jgi:hypothetical protein